MTHHASQVMDTDCEPEILCMIGEEYLRLGMLDGEPSAISIFQRALTKRKNSKVSKMCGSMVTVCTLNYDRWSGVYEPSAISKFQRSPTQRKLGLHQTQF